MSSSTTQDVAQILVAFNQGTAFADLVDEHAVLEFPYGPSLGIPERIEGPGAARTHLRQVQDSGLRLADPKIQELNDGGFLVEQRGLYTVDSSVLSIPIVSIVYLSNDRIVRLREYWDTALLATGQK
jgi:ketosteroid isomerase-like protein